MSFVFNQDDVGESSSAICPGCRSPSSYSNDADIQCKECQMFFRRITVIQDDESPPRNTPSAEDQHTRDFVLRSEATEAGSRKRTLYELAEREEEDVRSFKRVRLISKRKRTDKLGLFPPGMAEAEARKRQRTQRLDDIMDSFGSLNKRFPNLRAQVDQYHAQVRQRARQPKQYNAEQDYLEQLSLLDRKLR